MSKQANLHHYDYPVLDVECTCAFCADWREKRTDFDKWKALTRSHKRSCFCWKCCRRRDAQTEYLASFNKRDVYCELSWYASKHEKTYGPTLINWVEAALLNDTLGSGWWSTRAPYYPLYHFLHKFQTAHSAAMPAVSGLFLNHLTA